MTTTELKQRIADYLDTMDRKPFTVSPLRNLLRDCLNHIEELEEKIHKLESAKVWTRLDQLQSQLRERDADCAAMREALRDAQMHIEADNIDWARFNDGPDHDPNYQPKFPEIVERCAKALSTTAGRELLERLQKAESERDELKRVFGKDQSWPLDDVLLSLRSAALHLLHDHDCDHQGHETIQCNVDRAQNYVFAIGKALQPKEAK